MNQENFNSSKYWQPILGPNLLRLICSQSYINHEAANSSILFLVVVVVVVSVVDDVADM